MNTRDSAPGEADAAAYGQAELRLEQNRYYWSSVPGDELLDRWLWDYVYRSSSAPVSVNKTFALASPFAAEATMTVALLGYTASATSPDHHATISVNGTAVGGVWWDGMTWATATVTVPAGVLLPGNNTVTVTSQPDTGLSQDVFYVDWIELAYATSLTAQGNALAWTYSAPGARRFAVAGFSQSSVAVYDVTNPAAVARLTSVAITGGAGNYTADFQDTISVPIAYRAVSDGAYRAVAGIVADTPSDLATAVMGADHLIITHSAFAAAAETLRAFRAASGLNAVLVDVQDVYDEFGYGIVGPQAIRAFVAYAYASGGEAAPAYVLLVGDGHYDPKHYDAGTRPSYIPPYLAPVDPWIGETAADNRYVTVDGADTMPDLMLGRLAVNSPAEAAAFVDKIIAYEQSPAPGPWQKQILAVADNADDGGNFSVLSNNLLAASVPAYSATKVYLGITHLTAGAARTAIQSALNSGKAFVNYIGHAYNKAWASEDLLTTADVNGLSNGDMLPVVLAMTCRDGSYHQPLDYTPSATGEEALAEVITRVAGKGAVASWSPTGLGVASGHDHLNRGFFEAFFQDYVGTVGAATAAGKLRLWSTGADLDLLDTYLLFGDPAMTIVNAPEPVEIANFDATATGHDIMLSWQATTEGEVAGYNLWRAASPAGATVKVNDALLPVSASGQVTNIYEFTDTAPEVCTVSYYWLEVVKTSGVSDWYGPQEAEGFCRRVYQPVVRDGKAMDPQ